MIWKERCQRRFRAKEIHKVEILRLISLTVQLNFQGKHLKEIQTPAIQKLAENWGIVILPLLSVISNVSWRPPDLDWTKSNSDGSLSADRVGYGAVLRNCDGEFLAAAAVRDQSLNSINLLEFRGILQGLKLARALDISKIHMESDSSTAIAWVQGQGSLPWQALRDHFCYICVTF
ncbi:hypothetical protein QJS04_geneDACA012756 [Acorus gramineus]|uniref:RNase H type-1 domain-containing protein n=1 Tax=Acorus gramineus TaxID=55184 RepID=A0AAV9A0G8_ACOGR|nr:hypothetical protein QJS04_geneDACA024036 [Acorus gramineus]KAK1258021.1 hypothetical protein QJS04_geneDACA012756 [Acorus gramineus]